MRVVIDTNVFISGIFWTGPPHQILMAWQQNQFKLAVTPAILEEYKRVSDIIGKKYPNIDLNFIIEWVTQHAELFAAINLSKPIFRDPDDDKFIACAIAADTKYIVTGDEDLLVLNETMDLEIIKPNTFVLKYITSRNLL